MMDDDIYMYDKYDTYHARQMNVHNVYFVYDLYDGEHDGDDDGDLQLQRRTFRKFVVLFDRIRKALGPT